MSLRAGYVGLLGLPNAGKSTLVNAIVGEKVSIVTSKPQTTRQRVTGLYSDKDVQAIFVDAPGVVRAQGPMNTFLHEELNAVIKDADVLFLLLQLDVPSPDVFNNLIAMAQASGKPVLGIITKVDRHEKHRVVVLQDLVLLAQIPVIKVSAEKRPEELKEEVLSWLKKHLPESTDSLFDPALYTTQNVRDICSELVREKCFEYLHQEVPFGLAIRILKFDESDPTLTKIHAEIWVSRESHQGIVIGRGGQILKTIGSEARRNIEKVVGNKVFLDLHVKVRKNWAKDEKIMKELGYVVPTSV
jgi:GTP-binding protein Era